VQGTFLSPGRLSLTTCTEVAGELDEKVFAAFVKNLHPRNCAKDVHDENRSLPDFRAHPARGPPEADSLRWAAADLRKEKLVLMRFKGR
jgi:hypothetical protein